MIPDLSIKGFLGRLPGILRRAGQQVIYSSLLLYHAFFQEGTPFWARNIIFGALAYLLAPIDSVPDLTPILGYTDDIGVLSFALVNIAAYVNDEVRLKARKNLHQLFGTIDLETLEAVDRKL
jgi:uncharacterized membrane protein YkvA (DUF1232 family)